MKLEELRRQIIETKYLSWWINPDEKKWNEDGSIDILGSVFLAPNPEIQMFKLPVKFNFIDDDFDCSFRGLETLDNFPNVVTEDVYCDGNPGKFTEEDVRKICKVSGNVYWKD